MNLDDQSNLNNVQNAARNLYYICMDWELYALVNA